MLLQKRNGVDVRLTLTINLCVAVVIFFLARTEMFGSGQDRMIAVTL